MKYIQILAIITIALISGCSSNNISNKNIILFADKNANYKKAVPEQFELVQSTKGMLIAKKNNTVLIIIPSKLFFRENTANFTIGAYQNFDLILDLINKYQNPVISVTGYGKINFLASERASKVRQYLWNAGITTNFIYSKSGNQALECVIIKYIEKDSSKLDFF